MKNKVNLEYYKVFYFVAKLKSVTLAANALNVSQPAVTQSIKQLEKGLKCKLFYRAKGGMDLTQEGKVIYKYVETGYSTLMQGERMLHDMLHMEEGEIQIGASDLTLKFFILKHLNEFKKIYPNIKINITNAPTPLTLQHIQDHSIDFAVVTTPIKNIKEYEVIPVVQIQDICVVGERYKHLAEETQNYDVLTQYPTIALTKNSNTRQYLDNFLSRNHISIRPDYNISNMDLIADFAKENLGIGFVVEEYVKELLESKKVYKLSFEEAPRPRYICIVVKKNAQLSKASKALLDYFSKQKL